MLLESSGSFAIGKFSEQLPNSPIRPVTGWRRPRAVAFERFPCRGFVLFPTDKVTGLGSRHCDAERLKALRASGGHPGGLWGSGHRSPDPAGPRGLCGEARGQEGGPAAVVTGGGCVVPSDVLRG